MISSDKYERNFYQSYAEAERSAVDTLRPRSPYYIWKTDEGLFDWTAIPKHLTSKGAFELVGGGRT